MEFHPNQLQHILSTHGYTLLSPIGKGGTATCYLVQSNHYKTTFVCKVIDTKNTKRSDLVEKTYYSELEVLSHIFHPNIIKLYDFFKQNTVLFLILEYCKRGSLDKLIEQKPLNHSLLRNYLNQLVDSLEYCHSIPIAHHDLKPANIFLDEYNRVKLADFGLAEIVKGNDLNCEAYSGSIPYMAPEIFEKKPYDSLKSDVWSLGVTAYQLLTGNLPFLSPSVRDMVCDMREERYSMSNAMPRDIATFIRMCLNPNPARRPTIEQLKGILHSELQPSESTLSLRRKRSSNCLSMASIGKLVRSAERFSISKTHSNLPPLKKIDVR